MKAPKEYRAWVNWMRKEYGKRNGCIPAFCFDNIEMERKLEKSKRRYRRKIK